MRWEANSAAARQWLRSSEKRPVTLKQAPVTPSEPRLPEVPPRVADAAGAPRFGTYSGELQSAGLEALSGPFQLSQPKRLLQHKRWHYQLVTTDEVVAMFAVVDVGYASNAFVAAVELSSGRPLLDAGFLGPPRSPLSYVGDEPAAGLRARFRVPGASLSVERPGRGERYRLRARTRHVPLVRGGLELDAELLAAGSAPALTVISPVEGGVVNVTQKRAGMVALGRLHAGGRTFVLDGGVGGVDYTQGYLARRTAWRWAMGAGRLEDGTPFGFNLVEGFNEARADCNENAAWVGQALLPLGRARFRWNDADLLDRWQVETACGRMSLTFRPLWVHREVRDLGLVKSRFAQPVGLFDGTLTVGGRTHALRDVGGVTEDQDTLW